MQSQREVWGWEQSVGFESHWPLSPMMVPRHSYRVELEKRVDRRIWPALGWRLNEYIEHRCSKDNKPTCAFDWVSIGYHHIRHDNGWVDWFPRSTAEHEHTTQKVCYFFCVVAIQEEVVRCRVGDIEWVNDCASWDVLLVICWKKSRMMSLIDDDIGQSRTIHWW